MKFPWTDTERLRLNALTPDDADAVFRLFSDPQVVAYYDLAPMTSLQQAHDLIALFATRFAAVSGIRWAIRLKSDGALIGTCGFNTWSAGMRHAVIGYDLMSTHWRQGYAQEAVGAILALAFRGELPCGPLHRIQADTIPGNQASEALLRRLGFQEEGLRRDAGYWKGRFHDLKCFGLLSSA